jgi:hypothetical protein
MPRPLLVCTTLAFWLVLPAAASARDHRSTAVKREFQLTHPCQATGPTSSACPGYVKDHIVPLVCGGPDAPSNMQWQTIGAALAKDRWEAKGCARQGEAIAGPSGSTIISQARRAALVLGGYSRICFCTRQP